MPSLRLLRFDRLLVTASTIRDEPKHLTAVPAFSPVERPDEEDGVEEGEEPGPELEPVEEGELVWPDAVEEAAVAVSC